MTYQPMEPGPHPVHQPVTTLSTKKGFFTQNLVSTMVLLGIIVFFIGTMTSTSTIWIKSPDYDDYSSYEAYEDAYKAYRDKQDNTIGTGNILVELGGLLTCMGFLGGAIDDNKIDVRVKCGFISAAIAFIITTLIVLSLITTTAGL
jgi:hypothetical protein